MRTRVSRRAFLGAIGAAAVAGPAARPDAAVERPNLLFILADDLGYGDLSCYGRPDYRTPAIDQLAREGLQFMSAYAAAPVCTPTRCAFHTGRYPQRLPVGLEEPLKPRTGAHLGLPPDHPTIATLLKKVGYETALIGKWHLGWKPEFGPNRHGYDEFFGILSGAGDYFTHSSDDFPNADGTFGGPDFWENLTPIQRIGYMTDLLSERAVQFISRRRANPFYLSLHYTAPHSPWEGPEDAAIGHTEHGPGPMVAGGSAKIYASMMKSMDAGIGRVLTALRRSGLERRTLVVFTSDNGGERYSYNWPFSFQKFDLHEGGTRVPAIVRWPGVVAAGGRTEQPAITMDWTSTLLAAGGATADPAYPLDGIDLTAALKGARAADDRPLFWRTALRDAVRLGKWKYLRDPEEEGLYDLSVDPGERGNVRRAHSQVFDDLRSRFAAWDRQMLPRPKPD
jgi:arylsulfatase A-like enzyme